MKIINKNNFLITVCVSYTIISLGIIIGEASASKGLSATHWNLITAFFLCCISVFVLSQHYRMERFSPLLAILLQYIVAIILVLFLVWMIGLTAELHQDAYRDVVVSFTIPYFIGALIYYVTLHVETKKQNKNLQLLKHFKREDS